MYLIKVPFQNFVLVKDVLGVTHIDDLSEADVKKVRALALIELTALLDTNNITYSRRKPKKRLKGKEFLEHRALMCLTFKLFSHVFL